MDFNSPGIWAFNY